MDLKHPWDSKGTAFQPQCVIANDYGLIANSEKNNRKQTRIHKTAKKYNEQSDINYIQETEKQS